MDETHISKFGPVKITLILGPPGSGKGTLAKRLATKQNMYHFSVGDHLHTLCADSHPEVSSAFGRMTKSTLKAALSAHELVPAENIVAMVWDKIGVEIDNGWSKFLLDGFPRDEKSAWHFDHALETHNAEPIKNVISISRPKSVAKDRFLERKREGTDTGSVFDKRYQEFLEKGTDVLKRYRNQMVAYVENVGSIEESEKELYKSLRLT